MQRYMQQHNEVELSALGMGIFFFTSACSIVYVVPISQYEMKCFCFDS